MAGLRFKLVTTLSPALERIVEEEQLIRFVPQVMIGIVMVRVQTSKFSVLRALNMWGPPSQSRLSHHRQSIPNRQLSCLRFDCLLLFIIDE